jgi:hypothetical protein
MPENIMMRKMLRLEEYEGVGGGRKLHNEKLQELYSLPSIIRKPKSRRMY